MQGKVTVGLASHWSCVADFGVFFTYWLTAYGREMGTSPSLHTGHHAAHTHTRLMALCPGLPDLAGTRKVKPIWILLKQETVSGGGVSWAVCKSALCCRQITAPAPPSRGTL